MKAALSLLLLYAVAGCGKSDRPPASDGTVVDTAAVDSTPFKVMPTPVPADTLITPSDSVAQEEVTRRPGGGVYRLASFASGTGKPAGLNKWPADRWCQGPMSGTSPQLRAALTCLRNLRW